MEQHEVRTLITYIEENLRSSRLSGLHFVDTRHFLDRFCSKQNHVVYGRRGAGKTSLVSSISDIHNHIYLYLNLEDYKDITFPNIVIHILIEMFTGLDKNVGDAYPWYRFSLRARRIKKRIKQVCFLLEDYLHQPDEEMQEVSTAEASSSGFSGGADLKAFKGGYHSNKAMSKEVRRTLPRDKLEFLKIELIAYKKLIEDVALLVLNKPIFLVLDDFYFVIKDSQPDLIDYFHRLTKGTSLFLKIATIKYRSKLYKRSYNQYTGVETGHDILEVDMDYSLDNFEELQVFMRELLIGAIQGSNSTIDINDMFAGEGFAQLCLASGGVPRDFLSLFVSLGNKLLENGHIGKIDVTDMAIANIASKKDSMKKDSGNDENILEDCLSRIKEFVFNIKRTNAFLITRDDSEQSSQLIQIIRELVDLRLIHLVHDNTSKAPSDGRRYEAYILDVGLYDNARPTNFKQIDPSQRDAKSRQDALRSSPVVSMRSIEQSKKEDATGKVVSVVDHLVLQPYQTEMSFSFE